MKAQLIAALLVAVSASAVAPAFAGETTVTRAQVRAELARLQQAGYPLNRATDATYPDDLRAALAQAQAQAGGPLVAGVPDSGYGGTGNGASQSGRRHMVSVAERSVYFGH
ncbi:hypothetical protein GQ57_10310 [Burkholderia sp. MSh2]|uniref:Membrane protein n=1 Tax=Burkholderia paludis TaxID=1506587 RepID=A0A6J5CYU1_9BURK|nr:MULTISPECIES: DUF4148 domain-containing protein [Burkholderia]KEZ05813.1 hypothetical protein GQ57_10310 [Burkholderia sp. MSh2]KFG95111.1 hypothetical protein GQ56_0122605 [Burkholderia paludis]CAB3746307.1 hypothetical protein LMG30113_00161 [Burkholderia paludis]VWB24199.1 membrane protein [Burkholderia paludis]